MQDRVEQRYGIADGAAVLFLMGRPAVSWQVWLNQKQDFDGVVIGQGASRDKAIGEALELLLEGVRALRALTNGAAGAVELASNVD